MANVPFTSQVWIATSRSPDVVPVGGAGTGLPEVLRASSLVARRLTGTVPPRSRGHFSTGGGRGQKAPSAAAVRAVAATPVAELVCTAWRNARTSAMSVAK